MGNAGLFVIGAVGLCAAQDLATLLIARVIVGYENQFIGFHRESAREH